MAKKPAPSTSHAKTRITAGVLGILIVALAVWCWPRSKVELNEQGYDLTIALYRACNQRSLDSIAKIETLLAEKVPSHTPADSAHQAIQAILEQAKSGHWKDASIACRQVLEDQVQR